MTLLLASLLQLAAAVSAWCLTRRRADHRPVALALTVVTVASLLRAARWRWFVPAGEFPPGPYHGWARVGFHVEQALWLLGPAALAWVALVVLYGYDSITAKPGEILPITSAKVEAETRPVGPPRGRSRGLFYWVAAAWLVLAAVCVLAYPALRDGPLRRVYLGVQLVALAVAVAASVAWLRRRWPLRERPTPAELVTLILMVCSLVDLLVGGWRYGLFGAAYEPTQAVLLVMYGAVVVVQVGSLLRRNGSP